MLSQQENTLELQLLILEQREELLKQNELKLQIFQTKAGQKLESIKTPKVKETNVEDPGNAPTLLLPKLKYTHTDKYITSGSNSKQAREKRKKPKKWNKKTRISSLFRLINKRSDRLSNGTISKQI